MKRGTLALLLACAGLSGACSDTQATTGFAGLSGTYDLTLVGNLVFVTSSDRDELQVLNLASNPREFIPAPNPLETLAIPVLDRPDALTHDIGYDAEGNDRTGPFVYARSAGATEISVVAAAPERLVQMARLQAGSLVTSFAARAPALPPAETPDAPPGPSTLYFAIQDPDSPFGPDTGGARVLRQALPGPEALDAGEAIAPAVTLFCLAPGESVQAMTILPNDEFVVATRSASGRAGRTLVVTDTHPTSNVDCTTPSTATRDLSAGFDNVPVRLVASHPRVVVVADDTSTTENETVTAPPGQFVFGVRDEVACSGAAECTGVLAVETATGTRATDLSGAPMFALRPTAGLPTGLSLVPSARLSVAQVDASGVLSTARLVRVPLLGIMPSSNGSISLFSAWDRSEFDLDDRGAQVSFVARDSTETDLTDQTVTGIVEVAQKVEYPCVPNDPSSPTVTRRTLFEGSVANSLYRVIFEGIFPWLADQPRDMTTPSSFEVLQPDESQKQVRVGDVIVLTSSTVVCTTDLVVTSIRPGTGANKVFLETTTPIPDDCSPLPNFTVRASGSQSFLLVDADGNLLTRDIETVTGGYQIPTAYYYHPPNFLKDIPLVGSNSQCGVVQDLTVPAFPSTPPPVVVNVAGRGRLSRGDRVVITLTSGVRTYVFGVNSTSSSSGLSFYTLPGPVVAPQGGNVGLAYIAYPSADGILQVNLEQVVDNVLNTVALETFE
ncbi:hypothetical protein LZ198_36040 [Myxococcus sp. K15C18031901]|uniref:hypothetical protein n=1 Tax=Myxococcus dinghuensis TaxID=2906761 RepID=UPI0020A719D3|nr:hypothetical protein [Myxococcus dinghuensis]MCP3104289.1 hypothetical protein [Myxococcus dinghuensis]